MTQTILFAIAREFQDNRSLCPTTYRAMRAVEEKRHQEVDRGIFTADQEEIREAKAAITLQISAH